MYRQRTSRTARLWRRAASGALSIAVVLLALTGPSVRSAAAESPTVLNPIDINGGGDGNTAGVADQVTLNGLTYFAGDAGSGTELLVSDGTQAGTHMVADLNPDGSSFPNRFVVMGGVIYFTAMDLTGAQLYRSDGTMAGTQQVYMPGSFSANPVHLTVVGDTLYFAAWTTDGGQWNLYATDGTEYGTHLIKNLDIVPNLEWTWASLNGRLYFPATEDSCAGLFTSDGTALGTYRINAASGETWCSEVTHLTAVGSHLYMSSGTYMGSGEDLWISDGTTAGTFHMDLAPGFDSSFPSNFTAAGDLAFFTANDGTHGRELWRSDGTAPGTYQVVDLTPAIGTDSINHWDCGNAYDCEDPLTTLNGDVYFAVGNFGITGNVAIYRTDGTETGTQPISDTSLGKEAFNPLVVGQRLYYFECIIPVRCSLIASNPSGTASDAVPSRTVGLVYAIADLDGMTEYMHFSGSYLWVSYQDGDIGTEIATIAVSTLPVSEADPVITGRSARVGSLLHVDTGRWSAVGDVTYSYQWYRCTDATVGSCSEIADATAAAYAVRGPDQGLTLRARVTAHTKAGVAHRYTAAREVVTSTWLPNTSSGAIVPDYFGDDPVQVGNLSYVVMSDAAHGRELYKSDGTAVGTTLVADICPEECSSDPSYLTNLNGILVFSARGHASDTQLWRSDGTAAGTYPISTGVGSGEGLNPTLLAATGTTLFFVGVDPTYSRQLFMSDGTLAGTHKVTTDAADPVAIPYGAQMLAVPRFSDSGVALAFAAVDPTFGSEVWVYDVDRAQFSHTDMKPGDANPSAFHLLNGTLYFLADDLMHGRELRRYSSLESGPQLVAETVVGSDYGAVGDYMTEAGGRLYYNVLDPLTGATVYASDGTADGTQPVLNTGSSYAIDFIAASDQVYFTVWNGSGFDLYSSAGTPEGTREIYANYSGVDGINLVTVGNTLYFDDHNPTYDEVTLYSTSGTADSVAPIFTSALAAYGAGDILKVLSLNGTLVLSRLSPTYAAELSFPQSLSPPINIAAPSITYTHDSMYHADLAFGRVLTAHSGTWEGAPSPTMHYQWLACSTSFADSCAEISSAIAPTYRIRQVDATKYLRVRVTGTSAAGSGSVLSDSIKIPYSSLAPLDLNTTTDGSWASGFTQAGAYTYFTARGADGNSNELWRTDGTDAGTIQLTFCTTHNFMGGCGASNLVAMGSAVYFSYRTPNAGRELWKSTGTVAGTTLLKDIAVGTDDSSPEQLTAVGNTLYFAAWTSANAKEPWKSDGTSAGTTILKDIAAGTGYSWPAQFTAVGSTVYFSACTDSTGCELWKTNGTLAGTTLVSDAVAGPDSSQMYTFVPLGSTLYYIGGVNGDRIWKSGGTAATTMPVPATTNGAWGLTAFGGSLYYSYDDTTHGRELWKTDGTLSGTQLVKDLYPGTASSAPEDLTPVGTRLVFTAIDAAHGRELWSTGGTSATTAMVADIRAGFNYSYIGSIVNLDGIAYFTANDGINGVEPWFYDVTLGTTGLLIDTNPVIGGLESDFSRDITVAGGKLWFAADNGSVGAEPWVSDGSPDGTYLLKDLVTLPGNSNPTRPVVLGDTTYFYADNGVHGFELWDIPAGSTPELWDINPTGSSAAPWESNTADVQMVKSGSRLFFVADDGTNGQEIWTLTEGNAPVISGSTYEGPYNNQNYYISDLTAFGNSGKVFFSAADPERGRELWMNDGTDSHLVADIMSGDGSSYPQNFVSINGWMYFTAQDGIHGRELWRTDGTTTTIVSDIWSGTTSSDPRDFTAVGSRIYFSADGNGTGRELYVLTEETPGTPVVSLAADLEEGSGSSFPGNLVSFNGELYFSAYGSSIGREMFQTHGADEVKLVQDFCAGTCWGNPGNLTVVHDTVDRLYFDVTYGSVPTLNWLDATDGAVYGVPDIGATYWEELSSPVDGVLYSFIDAGSHGWQRFEVTGREGTVTRLGDVNDTADYLPPWAYAWSNCDFDGLCADLVPTSAGYYGPGTNAQVGSELFYSAIETAPVLESAPVLSGSATVGSRITTTDGVWTSVPNADVSDYQPMLCSNATSLRSCRVRGFADDVPSFVLTNSDVGSYVRFKVTATTRAGSTVAYSDAKLIPLTVPTSSVAPTLTGTTKVGNRLVAAPGTYTGNPTPGLSYSWYRCAKAATAVSTTATVTGCTLISGAKSNTYTLVTADIGKFVRVRVTASSRGGTIYRWSKSAPKAAR